MRGTSIKAWLTGAAVALLMAVTPFATATPASAEVEQWETFHGCVVTVGDDYVVIRVQGSGHGPAGLYRFGLTGATTLEADISADARIAVLAWKEDGEWYAASITAEREEDGGEVEVTRRRRGPSN